MNESPNTIYRMLLVAQQGSSLYETHAALNNLSHLSSSHDSLSFPPTLELDIAHNGEDALANVRVSVENNARYSVAFIDLTLPGWSDGIETTQRLWRIDADLQVVIMRSSQDIRWEDIVARLPDLDRYLILNEPFDATEIRHTALALASKRQAQATGHSRSPAVETSCLTRREKQVMELLVEGIHTKAIAARLGVSPKTVEAHRSNLLRKLNIDSVVQLVRLVLTTEPEPLATLNH